MQDTRTESEASNVPAQVNVEEFANALSKIIEKSFNSPIISGETKILLNILDGIIALQVGIYQSQKIGLINTGSKT